jgi:AraC-like DNA-binding protein
MLTAQGPVEFDRWAADLVGICGHYLGRPRPGQKTVRGEVRVRCFDDLDVADIEGDIERVTRDRRGLRRDEAEHIFFVTQITGSMKVDHNGYRECLNAGDSLLVDSTRVGELQFAEQGTRVLSLHMPRHVFLAASAGDVAIGRRLDFRHPLSGAIRRQLEIGTLGHDEGAGALSCASSSLMLEMIHLAFRTSDAAPDAERPGYADRRFELALHLIDTHLHSETLTLDWLAHRMKLSKRQIQRLFADRGTSFVTLVRDKRARLAADYMLKSGRPARISDAAFRAGFRDLSTFNRSFKACFGQTPREFLEAGRPQR